MTDSLWDIMNSDDPSVIKQCLQWLNEVEPGAHRTLERRLHSNIDDYRSARMELYLHHVFQDRGYEIAWEPALPGTRRVTEFRAKSADTTILVEARVSAQERAIQEHWDVDFPLKEKFEALLLPSVLSFGFIGTPPPLHRLEEIWNYAREAVTRVESERESGTSCHDEVLMQISGSTYLLRFSLLAPSEGDASAACGLVIPNTPAQELDPSRKLYYDILQKATRYGELCEPFMIAVWGGHMGREPELAALYGAQQLHLNVEGQNSRAYYYESRESDGIFTARTDGGQPAYRYVSAVGFVRSSSTGGGVDDSLVIYHNPYAIHPLDLSMLGDFCQYTGMPPRPTKDSRLVQPPDIQEEERPP